MIAQRYAWPSMQKNITYCQRSKIYRHNIRNPEQIPVSDERFLYIHLDVVGPLLKGFRYCLTMIDRTTRWPEATLVPDCTADNLITAFFNTWISRYEH